MHCLCRAGDTFIHSMDFDTTRTKAWSVGHKIPTCAQPTIVFHVELHSSTTSTYPKGFAIHRLPDLGGPYAESLKATQHQTACDSPNLALPDEIGCSMWRGRYRSPSILDFDRELTIEYRKVLARTIEASGSDMTGLETLGPCCRCYDSHASDETKPR